MYYTLFTGVLAGSLYGSYQLVFVRDLYHHVDDLCLCRVTL